jgi:hypothetical protein
LLAGAFYNLYFIYALTFYVCYVIIYGGICSIAKYLAGEPNSCVAILSANYPKVYTYYSLFSSNSG